MAATSREGEEELLRLFLDEGSTIISLLIWRSENFPDRFFHSVTIFVMGCGPRPGMPMTSRPLLRVIDRAGVADCIVARFP